MSGAGALLRRADSPLVARLAPSPNFGERRGGRGIDMIVLHYTGCPSAEAACLWMCSPDAQVSAHYLVEEDGEIVQLVAEQMRAWHAGAAFWAGVEDVNSCSIGIEIQNAGHAVAEAGAMPEGAVDPRVKPGDDGGGGGDDGGGNGSEIQNAGHGEACGSGGLPPYPQAQMRAVLALVEDIARRHGIRPERVVGHSDVAPLRKADPGEHFPWHMLAQAGLALPAPEVALPQATPLDAEGVRMVQEKLARIGYGAPVSGEACDVTTAVVRAFQRRFMPRRVDGVADAQVLAMAEAVCDLLDARGVSA